jgi:hypothetical protein
LLYTLPAGHKWTCQRGVTLLGDAAHLMTPFGGNGEHDGADSIEAYEAKICECAAPEAAEALNSLMETFSEAGPRHWLDQLSRPDAKLVSNLERPRGGAADRRRRGASHEDGKRTLRGGRTEDDRPSRL